MDKLIDELEKFVESAKGELAKMARKASLADIAEIADAVVSLRDIEGYCDKHVPEMAPMDESEHAHSGWIGENIGEELADAQKYWKLYAQHKIELFRQLAREELAHAERLIALAAERGEDAKAIAAYKQTAAGLKQRFG
ncbi:MAG: hypothetical protein FWG30_12075 [Eubacteriaceae bacterium]|nr:hypothetical protein [Eubacteriaceae bacterium]